MANWEQTIFKAIKDKEPVYVFEDLLKQGPRKAEILTDEKKWNLMHCICLHAPNEYLKMTAKYCEFTSMAVCTTPSDDSMFPNYSPYKIAEKMGHSAIMREYESCIRYEWALTPLMKAVRNQDIELVKQLASTHSDINEKCESIKSEQMQHSALYLAVLVGNKDIVDILLEAGSDPSKAHSHASLAHAAAESGHDHLLQFLVDELSQDVNTKATWESTVSKVPIETAATWGHFNTVVSLIDMGAHVTPGLFTCAAMGGNLNLVKYLDSKYQDVTNKKCTQASLDALHGASICGNVKMVSYLITEQGMDPNEEYNCDYMERTPLEGASFNGHLETVKALMREGARITESTLSCAARNGHNQIVKYLLEEPDFNVDVNAKDHYNYTALHRACVYNHLFTVKLLLQHGAMVSMKNSEGYTALHYAVKSGNPELVKVLIEQSSSIINSRNYYERELFLIRNNKDGNSTWKYIEIWRQMMPKYRKVTEFNVQSFGRVIFTGPGENPPEDIRNEILEENEKILSEEQEDQTPLHVAVSTPNPSPTVVRILLESGCDIDCTDHFKFTPLDLAAANGDLDVVELLLEHGAANVESALNIALDNDLDGDHEKVISRLTEAMGN